MGEKVWEKTALFLSDTADVLATPSFWGFVPVEDKMTGVCVARVTFKKVK